MKLSFDGIRMTLADQFNKLSIKEEFDMLTEGFDPKPLSPVYRMPERDSHTGPSLRFAKNDLINVKRVIVRIGYEYGVHSVTAQQWSQAGLDIIVRNTGLSPDIVMQVLIALRMRRPFKEIKQEIYQTLVEPIVSASKARERAMWFHDLARTQTVTICGTASKLTGVWSPGSVVGDFDYEPPCLTNSHKQSLYRVYIDIPTAEDPFGYSHGVWVYPDDAKSA